MDKLPEPVRRFLRDLEGALGDRMVGVLLYGSWNSGKQNAASDLDLAVIVSDADAERSRQEIFRVLAACGVDRNTLSMSVESYMRIKEFLKLGDPFAWVVCSTGQIIKERDTLLTDLQKHCKGEAEPPDAAAVKGYLQNKSATHYVQAMQALNQFYSNIQLSLMAGAQAVAASQSKGAIKADKLVRLADWAHLKETLQESTATRREIESVEQLIMAHKQVRKADKDANEFPGKDLLDGVRAAGELWKRLLPTKDSMRD
jgi:hypothetical protein